MAFDLWTNPKKTDIFGLGSSSKASSRDSRRAFNQTQKKEILYQQNSKCARCHKHLDPRATQLDHKKPWHDKGRTITRNGRALCGTCHDIITHQTRLKKTDNKRKSKSSTDVFGLGKLGL